VCAPSSSLHNGYGNFVVGKLPELMALGVNVAIGSDHASSGIVDMTQETRLACCCYKEMRLNPRVMPPEQGLEMATINGAKAALMDKRIGSIEVGKEADIVLFDTRRPEWQPLINPVANLVYSATGDSVRDVFVMGDQVVKDGTLTKIDESRLYEEIPVAVSRFSKHLKIDQMVQLKWPVS
jgi:5-methylthioadenosine/S-adenosylhomocysteine deaminase